MSKGISVKIIVAEAGGTFTEQVMIDSSTAMQPQIKEVVCKIEKAMLGEALTRCRWNRGVAARVLEISYRSILYKMKEYGLSNKELTNGQNC